MVCRNQPAEEDPLDTTLVSQPVFVDVKRSVETKKVEVSLTVALAPHPKKSNGGGGSLYPSHTQIYMHMRSKPILRRSHPQGVVQPLQTPESLIEPSGLSKCSIS